MKPSEPIGNPIWGAFIVRVTLGAFLVLLGLGVISDNGASHAALSQLPALTADGPVLSKVPPELVSGFRAFIPYLEIAIGTLLILGFWTTYAAIAAAVLLGLFVQKVGIFLPTGAEATAKLLNKDTILLAAALSLLYTGSGAMSVDGFRKSG